MSDSDSHKVQGWEAAGIYLKALNDRLNPQSEPPNDVVSALYYIGDQLKNLNAVLDEALPELTKAAQIKRRYVTIVLDDEDDELR